MSEWELVWIGNPFSYLIISQQRSRVLGTTKEHQLPSNAPETVHGNQTTIIWMTHEGLQELPGAALHFLQSWDPPKVHLLYHTAENNFSCMVLSPVNSHTPFHHSLYFHPPCCLLYHCAVHLSKTEEKAKKSWKGKGERKKRHGLTKFTC